MKTISLNTWAEFKGQIEELNRETQELRDKKQGYVDAQYFAAMRIPDGNLNLH
jgi:hypothetical protein